MDVKQYKWRRYKWLYYESIGFTKSRDGIVQGGRSCAGARGSPAKSLDLDENFKLEQTLFCRELRFVAIYALFGVLWAKKVSFWVKNSVSWARSVLLHGIYCIFH